MVLLVSWLPGVREVLIWVAPQGVLQGLLMLALCLEELEAVGSEEHEVPGREYGLPEKLHAPGFRQG